MINVGIIGGSGMVGFHLASLLSNKKDVVIDMITSESLVHQSVKEYYLKEYETSVDTDLAFSELDFNRLNEMDLVFLAVPHGKAREVAGHITTKVIDMSTDHRNEWTYGLPELHREKIAASKQVANPGCYATACILSVFPIKDLIDDVVFDGISGYSGGGKNPPYDYKENIIAYKLKDHHHVKEISNELGLKGISFAPHVIDTFRGLMCTAHVKLTHKVDVDNIVESFEKFYANTKTEVIRDIPNTKRVVGTDRCAIGGFIYDNNEKMVIVSVIDNLMKGAASQAVENMELMLNEGHSPS